MNRKERRALYARLLVDPAVPFLDELSPVRRYRHEY